MTQSTHRAQAAAGMGTALLLLIALLTMMGMVLAPPASAHHKPNHRGGPPPHSNAGGNGGQGQGPYGGETCADGGQGQGHQQHGNGNGYGHCRNEGNPGHGGTPPGQDRGKSAGFASADTVAPCSTVVVAGSGWQPGAPVQLSGGFDGSGCGAQAAAQPVSAAAAGGGERPSTVQGTGTEQAAVADEVGNVYAEVMVPADVIAGETRELVLEGTAVNGEPRTDGYLYEVVPTVLTNTQASTTALPNRTNGLIALAMVAAVLLSMGMTRMVRRVRA